MPSATISAAAPPARAPSMRRAVARVRTTTTRETGIWSVLRRFGNSLGRWVLGQDDAKPAGLQVAESRFILPFAPDRDLNGFVSLSWCVEYDSEPNVVFPFCQRASFSCPPHFVFDQVILILQRPGFSITLAPQKN
jgi:hypothetical protein